VTAAVLILPGAAGARSGPPLRTAATIPDVTIVCPNWFFATVAADSQRTSGSVSV
jgi:hypothetical protein